MQLTEKILCSAIWFNDGTKHPHQPRNIEEGFVVCGRRHHNCYALVQSIGKALGYDKTLIVKKGISLERREIQGFLTDKDRFVDREEASAIALESGQINKALSKLYSEDIW